MLRRPMTEARTERISLRKLAAAGGHKPFSRALCGAVALVALGFAVDLPAASGLLGTGFAAAFEIARAPNPQLVDGGLALRGIAEAFAGVATPLLLPLLFGVVAVGTLQVVTVRLPQGRGPARTPFDLAARLRQLLSSERALDAAISLAMLIVLAAVAWLTLAPNARGVLALGGAEPRAAARSLVALFGTLAFRLLIAGLAFGVLDYLQRRVRHTLSLRMTPRELREEQREQYGNPAVRAERARRLREGRK